MICLIALIVFGVMGIFSATHRKLAAEAFDCVFRRITLRKCESGLDKRLKSTITGRLMRKNPVIAGKLYRHFEIVSWAFTLLLVVSLVYSGISIYNYAVYGNCNGKENGEGFCLFDPAGNSKFSTFQSKYSEEVVYPGVDDDPSIGPADAPVTIIEFGCFRCPFTKKAEKTVKEVLEAYGDKVYFVFRDFPLNVKHVGADIHAEAANCALDQGKYWEFKDFLFEQQDLMPTHTPEDMKALASEFGLDTEAFNECVDTRKYQDEVHKDFEDGLKAGIYGTPTFFINNHTLVGPQPFKKFKKIIDEELE